MALWLIVGVAIALASPFTNTAVVELDGAKYAVYTADNLARWTIGYMNVTAYDPRGVGAVGMLFVFPKNSTYCFWMKNTYLPLRMVWIAGETVTQSALAAPLDTTPICGYGDKVLELRPDLPPPAVVAVERPRRPGP
ncbi:DUF192 domain-containing protein [Pyrobaculum neutrophilum]|uniref:DUF192 domain-containing protein n=1 Tax=Pyrobaculum neutrophilum (strain DSM 2338 / JCM 9278 / NBRC 100436 / V24Sta) TaxID=444157 RepID=B1YAY4_PYRNV|nr:DUF192 domain-containing protein [Pyrobaculum neutrophilum]ACB40684.1 protein of unknown function DUF192 [Pyrobaculum neutrophilum V24Sta]